MGFSRAKEDRPTPPEIYNYRIYMLTFLACLGSWMFGYNNGVIAGVLVLPSFETDFRLPAAGTEAYDTVVSNIVSVLQLGGLVGSVGTFPLMRVSGRKIAMAVAAAVYLLGAALQTFSYGDLGMMYAGRFITGLGAGSATALVPTYIAELAPPSIRGSLVGIYEINNQASALVGYWANYIVNQYIPASETRQWQIPLAMQMVPSTLLVLAAIFVLPESPRFLVRKGRHAQARKVLAYVRHLDGEHEYVNFEMEEMEEAIEREDQPPQVRPGATSGGGGGGVPGNQGRAQLFKELWWKGNRARVFIGLGLMFGQNLTGINGVNFYTPTIFRAIGFQGTRVGLLASGMYAAVKFIATILSLSFFIDRLGRRKLLIVSSIGTSLSLWYIGAFITASHIDFDSGTGQRTPGGWVAIVAVYVYAASFSFAWNGVVWVVCAEIFPGRVKDLAVCGCTGMQWLSQFAVARASPSMLSSWHEGFFFFFASCIVIMGLGVFFLLPETKGRTLEGMDEVFGSAYKEVAEVEVGVQLDDYRRERGLVVGTKSRGISGGGEVNETGDVEAGR